MEPPFLERVVHQRRYRPIVVVEGLVRDVEAINAWMPDRCDGSSSVKCVGCYSGKHLQAWPEARGRAPARAIKSAAIILMFVCRWGFYVSRV